MAKNTICLWYDNDAEAAARFYAETFPDSAVGAVHRAPSDYPSGKQGDVLTVEFTVARLAPQMYGDHVEHNSKGGVNFQPQILIQCRSAGDDEGYIDISAAPEAAGSLPQQGNGNSLRGSGGRR